MKRAELDAGTGKRYSLTEAQRELSIRECALYSGHAPIHANQIPEGTFEAWCECGEVHWMRDNGVAALLDYCDKISTSPNAIIEVATVREAIKTGRMPPLRPKVEGQHASGVEAKTGPITGRKPARNSRAIAALRQGQSQRGRQGRIPRTVSFRRAQ
jgi:hypothetical protein